MSDYSANQPQCGHCGYFYDGEPTFYSEDYARYYIESPITIINWCFHCTRVSVLKQSKMMGLIPTNSMKYVAVMTVDQFIPSEYGTIQDYEVSMVGPQLLRLIWLSLLQHQSETKDSKEHFLAFKLCLEKFSPLTIASMLFVIKNYQGFASLERQLYEGTYMQHQYTQYVIDDWLSRIQSHPKYHFIKEQLDNLNQ